MGLDLENVNHQHAYLRSREGTWASLDILEQWLVTEVLSQHCLSVSCVSVCLAWASFSVERSQCTKLVASVMRTSKPGDLGAQKGGRMSAGG